MADFFQQFDLNLLNLEQTVVLPAQQMIDLFVQMPDLELGFQIDFVIVLRAQPIARFGSVLTHHDDRCLNSSQAGQNQVEENERIGIECLCCKENAVNGYPDDEHRAKGDEKFPAATELGDVVGQSLAESQLPFELFAEVVGKNLVLLQALDDFLIKRGKLANFFLQDFFYVIFAEFAQVIQTNKAFAIQAGYAFVMNSSRDGRISSAIIPLGMILVSCRFGRFAVWLQLGSSQFCC